MKPRNRHVAMIARVDFCDFTKYPKAAPLMDKSTRSVDNFVMEKCVLPVWLSGNNIFYHQGRVFVNSLTDELYQLTGTRQKVTSATIHRQMGQLSV